MFAPNLKKIGKNNLTLGAHTYISFKTQNAKNKFKGPDSEHI